MVTASRDVVVMNGEADGVYTARFEGLVVRIGEIERSRPHHGPHTVFPGAGGHVVVRRRSLGIRPAGVVRRNQIPFFPVGIRVEGNGVYLAGQCGRLFANLILSGCIAAVLGRVVHVFWLIGFLVPVLAEWTFTRVIQAILENVEVVGHAHGIRPVTSPLHEVEEAALRFDLVDLRAAFGTRPIGVGARRWEVFAYVLFLQTAVTEQCVCFDVGLARLVRHVPLTVVTAHPAAVHVEVRYIAIVYEHRKAIFIDAGLLAFLHDLVEFGITIVLPLFPVIAAEGMRLSRIGITRLPLGPQVGVVLVVGKLQSQVDGGLLSFNRHRFEAPTGDDKFTDLLLLAFMAGGTAVALGDLFVGALVVLAVQPLVAGLSRIKQFDRRNRNLGPVRRRRAIGSQRCKGEQHSCHGGGGQGLDKPRAAGCAMVRICEH